MTLTVPEAARRVGRDPSTVRRWIRQGRLKATRVGSHQTVEADDLDELLGLGRDEAGGGLVEEQHRR